MAIENPQPTESPFNSWSTAHQQIAREYLEKIKDNPLVKKVVGATTDENFLLLGVYIDFEGDEELHDAISDAEHATTHDFPETTILFHMFDKSDVGNDILIDTLRELSEYKAPVVLLEREIQTAQA